jgi:thymidylate kinase
MASPGRHVIVEGLPAVGKSETLALLARFYPRTIRVLPELVKSVVEEERIDLFRERARLTQALALAVPRRRAEVEAALRAGFLCLEESHLGVHYAYAVALADTGFLEAYPDLERQAPRPDLYVRLDIPVSESIARQAARGTPAYDVREEVLARVFTELSHWHADRGSPLVVLDADRPPGEMLTDLEQALGLTYFRHQADSAFDVLLLLGRPASGKSEFIDFMTRVSGTERTRLFHIGPFSVADDFPILWQKFEEDDAWERLGFPRLYSKRADGNYAVSDDRIWRFLIDRLNAAAGALPTAPGRSLLIEFSRGGPAGYQDALAALSDEILSRSAILYLSVSFAESWRRNVARYDKKRRSGILTHSVPREEMERTYGTDDWPALTHGSSDGFLAVRGHRIPFATLVNEPEATDPEVLRSRYHGALETLFRLRGGRRS